MVRQWLIKNGKIPYRPKPPIQWWLKFELFFSVPKGLHLLEPHSEIPFKTPVDYQIN